MGHARFGSRSSRIPIRIAARRGIVRQLQANRCEATLEGDRKTIASSVTAARQLFASLQLCCLFLTMACGQAAESGGGDPTIRYLGIGNSFTWNSTDFLDELAAGEGKDLDVFVAGIGGASLEVHVERMEINSHDPENPKGKPYQSDRSGTDKNYSLVEILQAEPWDIVSIQQVSVKSFLPETYEPFAQKLVETIRRHAPQAEIVIHMTWAYRADHPWFVNGEMSQAEMREGLTAAYKTLSERYDLRINPIGEAIHQARSMDDWQFSFPDPDFNYDDSTPPSLPKQDGSLIVGWYWRDSDESEAPSLRLDGIHLNEAGRYLGALTQFGFLFESLPSEQAFRPDGLSEQQAARLRKAARLALEKYRDVNAAVAAPAARCFPGKG